VSNTVLIRLPAELRNCEQWVDWKKEARGDKQTKVPYNPRTGERAATNDPRTWAPFDVALQALKTGAYGGIGFVFTNNDPYVGVDLDKCRDPESGSIAPWARGIVDRLDSFTEPSPSGTGLHIITRGSLPSGGRRKGLVEMYESGRYFTMTGDVLDGRLTIEERTPELAALHAEIFRPVTQPRSVLATAVGTPVDLADEALLQKARAAVNGSAFSALWRGDWQGYGPQSEADLALCAHLAFWTGGDAARVDRLFRQSGLYRDKWDRRHYGDGRSYGEVTVMKAIQNAQRFGSRQPGQRARGTDTRKRAPWNSRARGRPAVPEMSEGVSRTVVVEVA